MQKTNKGAAKRFKVTASGKVKCKHAYLRHILSNKTEKQKRKLKQPGMIDHTDMERVKRLLPFSF